MRIHYLMRFFIVSRSRKIPSNMWTYNILHTCHLHHIFEMLFPYYTHMLFTGHLHPRLAVYRMSHQGESGRSSRTRSFMSLSDASTLIQKKLDKIIHWHRLNPTHVRLPTAIERAHTPLAGYMSFSYPHCDAGAVPPLADYYLQFLDHLRVVPFQLAPDTYSILVGFRRLFEFGFQRESTVQEVLYLHKHKQTQNPSFFHLESNHINKKSFPAILNLKSNTVDYQKKYFFIQDDSRPHWNFGLPSESPSFLSYWSISWSNQLSFDRLIRTTIRDE